MTLRAATLAAALLTAGAAHATEPITSLDNTCAPPPAQVSACTGDSDCAANVYATHCVADDSGGATCQFPCATTSTSPSGTAADAGACSFGETCTQGRTGSGNDETYWCKPTRFRMSLNLLDRCIAYFLEGREQLDDTGGACSLDANLTSLLNQDGDPEFNVFDVDLCVIAFLEQPACRLDATGSAWTCDDDELVGCSDDATCGAGAHCDLATHTCQRHCGRVVSREADIDDFDWPCFGPGKLCNRSLGRCDAVDVTLTSCQVDRDCANGAYCFLGRCEPRCFRAVDCPGTDWFCADDNRCRAKPHPAADGGFQFEPQDYVLRFTRAGLSLDAVQTTDETPLAIIDLITKRQVIGNPAVSFGYRLEVDYGVKLDKKCLPLPGDCADRAELDQTAVAGCDAMMTPAEQTACVDALTASCQAVVDDCTVDPQHESWVRLTSPFGTVSAIGEPRVGVALSQQVADQLTPGKYPATLRAFFDNGDAVSVPVTLTKATPSGTYQGTLNLFVGQAEDQQLTGNRPLSFALDLRLHDDVVQWDQLLDTWGVAVHTDLTDQTTGRFVEAEIDGASAIAFNHGSSLSASGNKIPFVGLYAPESGVLRLIGLIEVPATLCVGEDGACDPDDAEALAVGNVFGRTIRRQIELVGTFDEAAARFSGIYREKIWGLIPESDLTVSGNFLLDQAVADDSPLGLTPPLLDVGQLANAQLPPVVFPEGAIDGHLATAITRWCATDSADPSRNAAVTDALGHFASKATFDAYMAQLRRRGAGTADNPLGRTGIFADLVQFEPAIHQALTALGTDPAGQQSHLSIYDFLANRLLPCDPDDPAPPAICVDEGLARCGLALHQKALHAGWIRMDELHNPGHLPVSDAQELFCLDTIQLPGCPDDAAPYQGLVALQEHNRFWSDLGQLLKFDGDRARTEAFLTLFRDAVNPFARGAALSSKAQALRHAVMRYDDAVDVIAGPAATATLWQFPARAFKQAGEDWVKIMHAVALDRMSAVADLVDLRRRVFMSTGVTDFVYAQHLMHQEYLLQVYLMALQHHWQEELFGYEGQAGRVLDLGQSVLNQLNPSRNPIGFVPDQVFFENSDPTATNWQHYRNLMVGADGDGGRVEDARETVDDAVGELQSALSDLDTLEAALLDARHDLQDDLMAMCGDPDPGAPDSDPTDYCQWLLKRFQDTDDWKTVRDCKFGNASNQPVDNDACAKSFFYACPELSEAIDASGTGETNPCKQAVQVFVGGGNGVLGVPANSDAIANAPTCMLDSSAVTIDVNGQSRPCVGGQMAMLLQEKALLDRDRRIVVGSVETILRLIVSTATGLTVTDAKRDTFISKLRGLGAALAVLEGLDETAGGLIEGGKKLIEIPKCVLVAGLAVGTSCIGSAAKGFGSFVLDSVEGILNALMKSLKKGLEVQLEVEGVELEKDTDNLVVQVELAGLVREMDPLIDELNHLTQASFNVHAQIQDLRKQAQWAIDRHNEDVSFLADHLVGRESGNILTADQLVDEASREFRQLVQLGYKMVVAFVHHYNVPPGEAAQLVNAVTSAPTLDELVAVAETLNQREEQYCGLEAIDCDTDANVEILRFSVRDRLFPTLIATVDPVSGQAVTAGEQFHNTITRAPWLKRRIRGGLAVEQIELPLLIPVTMRESLGDREWLINPLTCNQLLDARAPTDPTGTGSYGTGNVAVNIEVARVDASDNVLKYELIRGPTDLIRACHPEPVTLDFGTLPVTQYAIRTHTVGYAPHAPQAQQQAPPIFSTRSSPFRACLNEAEAGGVLDDTGCWRFFARDRSLASNDWKLVIPLTIDGGDTENAWIAGDGLTDAERPLIEDIVVYFRYRARPVSEQ